MDSVPKRWECTYCENEMDAPLNEGGCRFCGKQGYRNPLGTTIKAKDKVQYLSDIKERIES